MSVRADLAEGIREGFPLCCVVRFALEELIWPGSEQAARRGQRQDGDKFYVPCGWYHKPHRRMRPGTTDELGCALFDEVDPCR